MIELDNLQFAYSKGIPVLNGVSFTAQRGEVINILGPNGCGKSTLIRLILGLIKASIGSVKIDGREIALMGRKETARKLSYVPQMHSGVFGYTVLDIVLMGRVAHGSWYQYGKSDYNAAYSALERMKLANYANRSYLHLSGGERQLVLIARALAQNAAYCIMDEPVSGLDYGNQFMLLQAIKDLSKEGLAFLLTTHHPEHAVFLGGRALLIKGGKIIGDGEPYKIITTNCICDLYNMPREMAKNFARFAGREHEIIS